MRLRNRPWKLLAVTVFGTAALVFTGVDLLDGDISLRRLGHLNIDASPARFWGFVAAYFLLGWGFVAFAWFAVLSEWKVDYTPQLKPPLDNPANLRVP